MDGDKYFTYGSYYMIAIDESFTYPHEITAINGFGDVQPNVEEPKEAGLSRDGKYRWSICPLEYITAGYGAQKETSKENSFSYSHSNSAILFRRNIRDVAKGTRN